MLRFLSFLGCIFSILTFLSFQLPSEKVKRFYISLDGNDQNTGTIEFPFAGFEAAQKAVKLEKQMELHKKMLHKMMKKIEELDARNV